MWYVAWLCGVGLAQAAANGAPLLFDRVKISTDSFEAASAFDVNNDGHMDIVSGAYWYEGPAFTTRHKICDVQPSGEYYDDFGDYPMDVNGDGYLDIITAGYWGKHLRWRENPKGLPTEWQTHDIAETGSVERPCFYDLDGDGVVEVVPNDTDSLTVYKLVVDGQGKGTGQFTRHVVKPGNAGHGLGFGDINGDGRVDIILCNGWYEAPPAGLDGEWTWHGEFNLPSASVPILGYDVNHDGLTDLIVGGAHAYGLDWWEQRRNPQGERTWEPHSIDPERSQYHDLSLADIDNDGSLELITGKRYRAHNGHDPGANDPLGVYYFEINGGQFERVTLDYGPAGRASGIGIYAWVEDVDGNGWKDIVAPGKEGLYLFKNLGKP